MLQLDKKFLSELENNWIKKIKVFLYEAGCSGKKVWVETEFEITDDLEELQQTPLSNFPLLGERASYSKNEVSSLLAGENWERCCVGNGYFMKIYTPKTDIQHLQDGRLTRTIKADHTGKEKIRFIFTSNEIQDRCGCGTSFAFEKKKPKIDFEKLKHLKANFNK